jgi:hypothetical protein
MGLAPHYTSPPKNPEDFVNFAIWATSRYASPVDKKAEIEVRREFDPGERLAVTT